MKPQGTAEGLSASSARPEATFRGTGTETLLEPMFERHNMLAALTRVKPIDAQRLAHVQKVPCALGRSSAGKGQQSISFVFEDASVVMGVPERLQGETR